MLAASVLAVPLLLSPAPASAHLRSGTVAVDYRISLQDGQSAAYRARVYQSDRGISLTVVPGHQVILLGYLHEPVFRLDRSGLAINAASPTAAAVGLLKKDQLVNARAPVWRLKAGKRSVVWHDARAGRLPPGIRTAAWAVPLVVDGRDARLSGGLTRLPPPSILVWLGVLLALLAVPLLVSVLWHAAELLATVAALVGAGVSVVVALVFALNRYASPGVWIAGIDEVVFLAVGVWLLVRGPVNLRVAGAIGTALVSLAVGLSKVAVFLHPIVLAVTPGTLTRVLVLVAIAVGISGAALGGASLARSWAAQDDGKAEIAQALPLER